MLRNQESRPEIAESYAETERKLTDRIKNDKGVQSKGATRKELEEFARESKKQEFDAEDHGVSVENVISPEYMIKESMKAGLSAAALTMILQTAPEIFKAIDYLIKTGEIDVDQLKKAGIKTVSSGAEAFLRGSVACALEIMCMKGAFGAALKSVDPTMLGSLVAITMETIKDSILVAAGKMTPREMGNALVDNAVATAGFLIGMKVSESIVAMKVSASIAGTITQIIGFEIPGLGYIIGSLIGCAISAVYNIGKKKLISFCVDTGFTCFGLVEQDYTLPEEILDEMGVELAEIENAEFETAEIDCADVDYAEVEEAELETIKITILKRGIIGVNKVGYILQDS